MDASSVANSPIDCARVLRMMEWRFKGGSMEEAAAGGTVEIEHSGAVWPDGMAVEYGEAMEYARKVDWCANVKLDGDVARKWISDAIVMRNYLSDRMTSRKRRVTKASLAGHVGSYAAIMSEMEDHTLDRPFVIQGAAAVYEAAQMVTSTAEARGLKATFYQGAQLRNFVKEVVMTGALGSSMHAPTAGEAVDVISDVLADTRVAGIMACWKVITRASRDISGGKRRAATLQLGNAILEHCDSADEAEALDMAADWVRVHSGFWETSSDLTLNTAQMTAWMKVSSSRVLVFGKSALNSLAQTLMSYVSHVISATADAYLEAKAWSRDPKGRATLVCKQIIETMDRMYAAGVMCSPGNHVKVCKSYKRAFSAYHATIAGPCAKDDVPILKDLARAVGEVDPEDLEVYWAMLAGFTAKEGHNIAKAFKICPPPDVSPGSTMLERISEIKNPNAFSERYGLDVMQELEIQIVFARCNMPGPKPPFKDPAFRPRWAAAYFRGDWDRVPIDSLPSLVAWENSLDMPIRSRLDPSVWKDSSVGADTLMEGLGGVDDSRKTNMKTRMLFDPEVPNPETRERNGEDVVEMLIKGEGHKDPARAIFSSNMRHRFRQSLLEAAVERVAEAHPAFFIGKGPEAYERIERLVTSTGSDPTVLPRYYSFDVSGWSAKMSYDIQLRSREIWAKLYGDSLFVESLSEMASAVIYLNKSGYIGWYRNTGSNLEGFDGKHLTMVNVAMLAATVKVWRRLAVADGLCEAHEARGVKAVLMSYIDDGMARVEFPARGGQAQAERCFKKFQATAKEVFGDASFTLDPPKCFPSEVFFVFLNEVYVAGRRVLHGTRAASSICGEPMEEHLSLPECVDKVTNGCRGVTKAGADATAASLLQAFHLYFLLGDWVKVGDPIVLSRWATTPRAMGGLGVPTQLQMGTTASGEPFAEGIATMQKLAKVTQYDAQLLAVMMTAEYEEVTKVNALVAPLAIHVKDGYMRTAAMTVAVRRAIEDYRDSGKELGEVAEQYLRFADPDALADYANVVVPTKGVVQEAFLEAAADCHPQKVFATFTRSIESSRTLRGIVGRGAYLKIVRENALEAKDSFEVFKDRMYAAIAMVGRLVI